MHSEATVFVVDDDPALLKSLSALIAVVFPRVKTYASAAAFLDEYEPNEPGCLVLDVAMPRMNGLELQRKLIEDQHEFPIVFLTGHANVQMAVGAMQAGAVNFLEKPFREQELWDSIRKALEVDEKTRRRRARRRRAEKRMARLSPGERQVLDLVLEGQSNKDMAAGLGLSVRTIEDRRARLMKKMQANSLVELIRLAMAR